ncbi:hypothetical protein M378DRAFT_168001, partial [Amanita muscaria Koide BX008]
VEARARLRATTWRCRRPTEPEGVEAFPTQLNISDTGELFFSEYLARICRCDLTGW